MNQLGVTSLLAIGVIFSVEFTLLPYPRGVKK